MGELVGFCTDLIANLIRLWAKYSAMLIRTVTKLFGQGVIITAENAAGQVKKAAKKADKKALIGIFAAFIIIAALLSGDCDSKKN